MGIGSKIRGSKKYKMLSDFLAVASEKRIDTYSAAAAFYIFMSFIPYLLIVLSTVRYLPFSKDDLLAFIDDVLPIGLNGATVYMIDELYAHGIGILSVSIIVAVWASAKGVLGITKGLNEIADVKSRQSFLYMRTRSAICTLLLMLGMILMLVISVFGNMIIDLAGRIVMIPDNIISILNAKNFIMWFVLFLLFMFFFCVLPDTKMKIRSQVVGAVVSSILWMIFTKLFSLYISTFNGYSMYGSFAVILVIGVWLYVGMYIMFMGALANRMIASRKGQNHERSY